MGLQLTVIFHILTSCNKLVVQSIKCPKIEKYALGHVLKLFVVSKQQAQIQRYYVFRDYVTKKLANPRNLEAGTSIIYVALSPNNCIEFNIKIVD